MILPLFLLSSLSSALTPSNWATEVCHWEATGSFGTVTYDLSSLTLSPGNAVAGNFYNITNEQTEQESVAGYYYLFNVCADTLEIPDESCCNINTATENDPPGWKEKQNEIHWSQDGYYDPNSKSTHPMTGPGPAWQIKYRTNDQDEFECERCYRLGRSGNAYTKIGLIGQEVDDNGNVIDSGMEIHPTRGVWIEYKMGDTDDNDGNIVPSGCSTKDGQHQNRQLRMEFYCKETEGDKTFEPQAPIEEAEEKCLYSVRFDSLAGCPKECPTICSPDASGNNKCRLCNGQGHCEIDDGLKRPRCFCNFGWTGQGCSIANNAEIPVAEKACIPAGSHRYISGRCLNNNQNFETTIYTNNGCTTVDSHKGNNGVKQYRANNGECIDFYNLGTLKATVTCIAEDAAVLTSCPDSINNGSSSSDNASWVVPIVLLLILMLLILGFIAWKQSKFPDLKSYLVLDETRGNASLQIDDEANL